MLLIEKSTVLVFSNLVFRLSNGFDIKWILALSVAQRPISGQLKTITIQSRSLGFQDLYFLNFVTCIREIVVRRIGKKVARNILCVIILKGKMRTNKDCKLFS